MELTNVVMVVMWIFIKSTSAQVPYLGGCPDLSPMENFNLSKFMGLWYEAERYFQIYQMGGKCVSLEYVQDGDHFIKTINRQKNLVSGSFTETVAKAIEVKNGLASEMFFSYPYLPRGTAWCQNTHQDGIYFHLIVFQDMGNPHYIIMNPTLQYIKLVDVPYMILDTDYDDYAVAWSCNSLRFASIRNAWILTRERHPSIGVMENAYSILDTNGISRAFFYRTDQTNCPDVEESKNLTISNTHDPKTRYYNYLS